MIAGCGKDSASNSSSLSPAPQSPTPHASGGDQGQELKVYEGVNNPVVNVFQAENVSQEEAHFDFTYLPQQDEGLALVSVKSYLIGCQDSDIGLGFDLFHAGRDGNIDFSSYDQLGPAPVFDNESGPAPIPVKRGQKYLLRVILTLQKSCLGLRYNFGVQESR